MEVAESSGGSDFLNWLGPDTSACVFHRLDDPTDLARAAAVSRSWRQFVIANEFCKSLCLRICPEVASFTRAAEVRESPQVPALEAGSGHDAEKDHRIYSNLGGALVSSKPSVDCILDCIGASSTDHFPAERMENTLDPRAMVRHRPSYWSSGGQYDPDVPESLTYGLHSNLCIVDEIRIQPYQVYVYDGQPIFSSKMVRVRIGRSKPFRGLAEVDNQTVISDDNYVWTYTSPDFPMLQENVLQSFKLPRPVLCIGGVVRIELLGRTQKAFDDMYYICSRSWCPRSAAKEPVKKPHKQRRRTSLPSSYTPSLPPIPKPPERLRLRHLRREGEAEGMRLVGLTGGIASGKSTVSNLFKDAGVPVVDADIVARDVVQKGTGGWKKIVKAFGNDILLENGEINRAHLGQIVFSDPSKRQLLNRLLAPHISWGIMWEIAKLWMKGCKVIILDIPLLFETKMDRWTNPVIVVWVNPETQIQRLMSRDGCSEEQAQNRINTQLALDWKKSEADIVIDNSGSLDDTRHQFREVLRKVSEPLTWKERLRSRDGLISVVVCIAVGVLLAQKNLL